MFTSQTMPGSTAKWDDLSLQTRPDLPQLDNIKTQLDLVLIALESLGKISADGISQAARELNLESIVGDGAGLWRLGPSHPQASSEGGQKRLDPEEAQALVLIAAHLADQQQETIRRMIADWQKAVAVGQPASREPAVADYIEDFTRIYQEKMDNSAPISPDLLSQVALKLLVELLFYSSSNGHQRLWNALLSRSH
jgi:hypothetical protein